jgi:large subunit ribosomal protein L28
MAKVCQVTGAKPSVGYTYVTRGIAKKKKGIGIKITGKTKRRFLPNLVRKRFWFAEEKRFVTIRLTAHAMRIIEKKGIGAIVRDLRARGKTL